MAQEFKDTQPIDEPNTTVDYKDPTDVSEVQDEIKYGVIDPISQTFALWIRTKMYRRHVRESLARMMEYTSVLFHKAKTLSENTLKRQKEVEKRQTLLEDRFRDVLTNATVDSEVILARDSANYGKFSTLDARMEHMEELFITFVPEGFDVEIQHNLGVMPSVVNVSTWQYGLGVLPLGTEENGLFGGTASEQLTSKLTNKTATACVVTLPKKYKCSAKMTKLDDYTYLLIDEETYRSIQFELHV